MPVNRFEVPLVLKTWEILGKRRRTQIVLLSFLMLAGSISEMVGIGAIVPFLTALMEPELIYQFQTWRIISDNFPAQGVEDLQTGFALLFVCAVLASSMIRFLVYYWQSRLVATISAEFRVRTYDIILQQTYLFHTARNSGGLIALVGKAGDLGFFFILPLLNLFNSALIGFGVFLALLIINPHVATITIISFSTLYAVIFLLSKAGIRKCSEEISRESSRSIQVLQEGFGGIRDVIIDGTHSFYNKSYAESCFRMTRAGVKIGLISVTPRFLVEGVGVVFIAIAALVMVRFGGGGEYALASLGALALGSQRLLPTLQQAYASYSTLRGYAVSSGEALDMLASKLSASKYENAVPLAFVHSIRLENINFQYSNDGPIVLSEINLLIKKRSKIGIIGPTGGGKSTFLDVVMGLLTPTGGQVSIDETILSVETIVAWQKNIAHVPQSIFLADATIAENIALGVPKPAIDQERLRRSAEQAQISKIIETLPDGYETVVGERGIRLSGGQRQRIGIARALYKQASIIVFDEATSALDTETEEEVMQAIESLGGDLTIIVVAHRLTTLRNCDSIIEIKNGSVHWQGSYGDLVAR